MSVTESIRCPSHPRRPLRMAGIRRGSRWAAPRAGAETLESRVLFAGVLNVSDASVVDAGGRINALDLAAAKQRLNLQLPPAALTPAASGLMLRLYERHGILDDTAPAAAAATKDVL